jgi:putative phage-type endonuclease
MQLQKNASWHEARQGRLTASNFAAAAGICPYKSRQKLWRELNGLDEPFTGNAATDWGECHEKDAINEYECVTGNIVLPVGFISHSSFGWLGCSPDGLVSIDGAVEAKCPMGERPNSEVPNHYQAQIQGQLECTNRDWCDFVSWTEAETVIIRVKRDQAYFGWLLNLLQEFWFDYVLKDIPPPRLGRKPKYVPAK